MYIIIISVLILQTINQSDDDQTAANPMLYGPLHGAKISKTNQYLATIIGECATNIDCARQRDTYQIKYMTLSFWFDLSANISVSAVCLSAVVAGTGLSWTSPVLPQLDDANGTLISGNGTLYASAEQREYFIICTYSIFLRGGVFAYLCASDIDNIAGNISSSVFITRSFAI